MTGRLYYTDSYVTEFSGSIVDIADEGRRIYLDQTAFYPNSGGQPSDRGEINGVPVIDVIDEEGRIAHVLEAPVAGPEARGRIDWARRFDHMQQHSGQHLLSAVFSAAFNIPTLSFHMGESVSTIELGAPTLDAQVLESAARQANAVVFENRALAVTFEHSSQAADLRKASEREGELRIVSISGVDRSACGGTHVRSTGEIGPILLRKTEKIRGNTRLEFLCGFRAIRRAQDDYEALVKISRLFSAPIDETPALVAAQGEKLLEADKARRKLASELAVARGRELYDGTVPDASGVRRAVLRIPKGAIDEDLRALANGFAARPGGVLVALIEEPATVMVAASKEGSPLHAGDTLKRLLAEAGGRGGGNAQTAQGSLPSKEALARVAAALGAA